MVSFRPAPQGDEGTVDEDDLPAPNRSILDGYREMIGVMIRQTREPGYDLRKALPPPRSPTALSSKRSTSNGIEGRHMTCRADAPTRETTDAADTIDFDRDAPTFTTHRDLLHGALRTVIGERFERRHAMSEPERSVEGARV
jgi:hypothetical protein